MFGRRRLTGPGAPELIMRAGTLVLVVFLAVLIARSYFGHSPGPYGACYAASGRSIPCAVDTSRRAAALPLR